MVDHTRFWLTKPMEDMTEAEWESLCDGCGKCCTFTLENDDTGDLFRTRVACRLFDSAACGCSDYANRFATVPTCIRLTPATVPTLDFLPVSCAYRLVAAGCDLPDWHHLVSGDRETIHREGWSVRHQTISEAQLEEDGTDPEDYITRWRRPPLPPKPPRRTRAALKRPREKGI
ncbi:MAG: YcgN family cysteine cluster protein [Alphaproteobacteria bacterium]|nr:YcgN family cysteine cluster protein [Alphaproteobacteria bacterium]TAD88507.1 MAG: YcgN family cysteine cluster protein [Alphaproteobacteria bacterium]